MNRVCFGAILPHFTMKYISYIVQTRNIMNNTQASQHERAYILRHGICLHMKMFVRRHCIYFHKNASCSWCCFLPLSKYYVKHIAHTCHSLIHITWIFPECFLNGKQIFLCITCLNSSQYAKTNPILKHMQHLKQVNQLILHFILITVSLSKCSLK